jgi:hypothetical protein
VDGNGTRTQPSQALPLLEELVWEPTHVVDGFAGAQPVVLCAPYDAIAELTTAGQGEGRSPLSRVRDFRCYGGEPQPSDVAAVLRAAPELRQFHAGFVHRPLEWHNDPAFAGLVHRRLRSLRFQSLSRSMPEEIFFASYDELQAHHFPRLRAFILE